MPMSSMPRSTVELRFEEPAAFRRFSRSLVETALVTGVLIRLYRAVVRAQASDGGIFWIVAMGIGTVIVVGMATAHLANYPIRRWLLRAPAFAVLALAAEMATSLLLIAAGRESVGSVRAGWGDWPAMAMDAFLFHTLPICAWAALLALAVTIARRLLRR